MQTLENSSFYRRPWVIAAAVAIALAAAWYFSHRSTPERSTADSPSRRGAGMDPSKRPSTVGTATVKLGDINVYQTGLGTAIPRNVVTVRTRVDGELIQVLFKEGQVVKRGDLLAQIDQRPYQVVLTQARGQLARDQALLKNAQLDFERYKTLLAQDSTSQQQLDTSAALVRQYQGTVEADQGQVDSATLSLTYTRITAPLDGRVGLRQVDAGNIVHASDTNGIVVITQIQPMTVLFAVPETRIAQIVRRMHGAEPVVVEAWDRDNKNRLATGVLIAADNQVDTTTGTVKLRAEFPNQDYALFANQFVNARALVDTKRQVPVIPAAAVQIGNDGSFVYVVQADDTVKVQTITAGIADGSQLAVDAGLTPGQVVVVDGLDRLREGSKVQVSTTGGRAISTGGAAPDRAAAGSSPATPSTPGVAGGKRRHRNGVTGVPAAGTPAAGSATPGT